MSGGANHWGGDARRESVGAEFDFRFKPVFKKTLRCVQSTRGPTYGSRIRGRGACGNSWEKVTREVE